MIRHKKLVTANGSQTWIHKVSPSTVDLFQDGMYRFPEIVEELSTLYYWYVRKGKGLESWTLLALVYT